MTNWTPEMFARLNQINAEIANVEGLISSKNQIIISALEKGTDTLEEEKQVGVLNKALQLKKGARRNSGALPRSYGGPNSIVAMRWDTIVA
jgi:hypothetical protein